MSEVIPLAVPSIGERERRYVLEAIDSGYVSSIGPFVSRFEAAFADTVGARHAVACASGTAAIHVGLLVLGVRAEDLVAVSDFTFVGSINPVAYTGADALLVDSDRASWNFDPTLFAEEIDRRAASGERIPKVVEVVHALGQPADLAPVVETCRTHGIEILEDAAESLGAGWSSGPLAGRHTGTVGRVGAFSFNGNKIATTGGGGMLVTDDEGLAQHARHLTTQAKVEGTGYLHDQIGYNYRLTNVAAALGLAQLERLPGFVARKREIARTYDAALAHTGLVLPPRVEGFTSTYWLYSVLVPEGPPGLRDRLLAHLQEAGIGARPLWRPLHEQPPHVGLPTVGGAVADELFRRGVSLPCSTELSDADQARVIDAVSAFFA